MLNDIVLNSIIVTIETLTYRKSIADKLISSSHGYHDLVVRASQFIIILSHDEYSTGIPPCHWQNHPRASSMRYTGRAMLDKYYNFVKTVKLSAL